MLFHACCHCPKLHLSASSSLPHFMFTVNTGNTEYFPARFPFCCPAFKAFKNVFIITVPW